MNKPQAIFLLLLTCVLAVLQCLPTSALAQQPATVVENIALKLFDFYTLQPQEKVYLHQDKPIYSVGETIWFKAYATVAPFNKPDTLSKIVYADLVSPDNKVLYTRMLQLKGGTAAGDFVLPDSLAEGNYQLRAYTNWKRNFDLEFIFKREVMIVPSATEQTQASINYSTTALGNGTDLISATLQLFHYPLEPIPGYKLDIEVVADGKNIKNQNLTTNATGIIKFDFALSNQKSKQPKDVYIYVQDSKKGSDFKRAFRVPVGTAELDLQFFPEGGNWVAGLEAVVAFKALGLDGKSRDVNGTIYDGLGNKIKDFKSEHLGMGSVRIMPVAGQTYVARVQAADGEQLEYVLPKTQDSGIAMRVERANEETVFVEMNHNLPPSNQLEDYYLVVHTEGRVAFAGKTDLRAGKTASYIPTYRIPKGPVLFTLFSEASQPVCERLVYVNWPDQLAVALTTNKSTYAQREEVKLKVAVKDAAGNPVAGNFSLAVRDAQDALEVAPHAETIYSNFFLSSELKGHVEQPSYYFSNTSDKVAQHLDLLMLTQGWRRFDWQQVLESNYAAVQYPLERSITISGSIEKALNNKNAGTTSLLLMLQKHKANGDIPTLVTTQTHEDGTFNFYGLHFTDTLNVLLQARTKRGGSHLNILRTKYGFPAPTHQSLDYLPGELDEAYRNKMSNWARTDRALKMASGSILLNQVNVRTSKQKKDEPFRNTSRADHVINTDERAVASTNVMQLLQGIAGVQVVGHGSNMSAIIRGMGTPKFLLDGMPVSFDMINMLMPDDIETVEVYKGVNANFFGPGTANGAIAFYTKRGNPNYDYSKIPAPGILSFTLPGYYQTKEFYSPRYDVADERHNLPDFRNTLYWQHTVETNAAGEAELSFFTSDDVTSFISTLEGIAPSGLVGSGGATFQVMQNK